jgi:hypothetical protein
MNIQFSSTICWRSCLFSSRCFWLGTIVKNHMALSVWIYSWVFYSISLVYVPIFFQHHALFVTMVLQYNLKSSIASYSGLPWLLGDSCAFIWILGLILIFLWRTSLEFW